MFCSALVMCALLVSSGLKAEEFAKINILLMVEPRIPHQLSKHAVNVAATVEFSIFEDRNGSLKVDKKTIKTLNMDIEHSDEVMPFQRDIEHSIRRSLGKWYFSFENSDGIEISKQKGTFYFLTNTDSKWKYNYFFEPHEDSIMVLPQG